MKACIGNPLTRCRHSNSVVAYLAAVGVVLTTNILLPNRASAQLLVDSTNSAIGASSSLPDAAHFQNTSPNTFSNVYVGYGANGTGYMDNTSDLTTDGAPVGGPYDTTGNWGLGVGEFSGGEGFFVNSGAGTINAAQIRIGDAFGGAPATGEFYQRSTGAVTTDVMTVGNAGGTGKLVVIGTGAITVNSQFYVGTYGGALISDGTLVQQGGALTLGIAGQEYTDERGYQELFIGALDANSTGHYDLQAGTLTVNGWLNVGRDGGTAVFTHKGTLTTTQELRVGVSYGGAVSTGSFVQSGAGSNVTVAAVGAESELYLGYGTGGDGHYDLQAGTLTVNGWSNLGRDGGTATFDNKGTFITTQELRVGTDYSVGSVSGGTATLHNFAGGIVEAGQIFIADAGASSIGTVTMDGGTISTSGWLSIGRYGTGTMVQNGGEIFVKTTNTGSSAFGTGQVAGSNGKFTQNHGSITVINDWFVSGVEGTGTAEILNDSTVLAQVLAAGQYAGSDGTITVNNPSGSITLASLDFAMYPAIVPVALTGWVYAGLDPGSKGTINLVAGSITAGDWTEIGLSGEGTLDVSGGSFSTGDNFRIGSYDGGVGVVNIHAGGTVTVVGNDPAFTGNLIVAGSGSGTLNVSGGLLDLVVGDTGTSKSASQSIADAGDLSQARDGNLVIGLATSLVAGTGLVNQTGGTINVAANVSVGSVAVIPLDPGPGDTMVGGKGTLTISGGAMKVGVTSPTGGDLVIGSVAGAIGTVNLQGGSLDVSKGTGKIGAALGTAAFNFTGGTLRVREFNTPVFGGNLVGLTQNGATSVLDVTGNDTTITGTYTLTAGTASVGATRVLSVTGNTQANGTFSTQITGTNIGKMAITGGLTLGATSVLDIQGNLATAITHVIATYNPGSLVGMFGNALDATSNGYNVIYENSQIILDELDGDANHDGVVNIFDINLVSANWNPAGPVGAFAPGNINHDTVVNIFDINQISSNWAHVATNGGVAHAQAVPEPATLGLAILGLAGLLFAARRNKLKS